jgi:hypothetical protein
MFGPTLSVVGGGLATLMVVGMVRTIWPQLVRIGPLHTLGAQATEAAERAAAAAESV